MPDFDVEINATFTAIDYTITVTQGENGTIAADKTTAHVGEVVTLTNNPNEDCVFVSYTVTDAEGNPVTVENNQFTMPASNVTVTATFRAYTVNYLIKWGEGANWGENVNEIAMEKDGEGKWITAQPTAMTATSQFKVVKDVRDGETFIGEHWFSKAGVSISSVPTTIEGLDENVIENMCFAKAGSYNFSLTVTDADSTVIQATYAITVEKKEKSITYIDGTDGVTVLTGLTPTEYTPGGSTVYLPDSSAVTKAGYTFNGWYLTPELDQGGSPIGAIYSFDSYTSDLTFYAKFTVQSYSISYRDHDNNYYYPGLEPSSYTITNTPVALATPAPRDGFTFDGWCENDDRSDPPIKTLPLNTTGYKTFYAKWTENGSGGGDDPIDPTGEGDVLVTFLDANGESMTTNCTPITADTATFTNGGWYVVNANVTREGTIAVEGAANLVLTDNKTLVITNIANFAAGVIVTNDVTGGLGGAAIGGGYQQSCGAVTINGGRVDATSGNSASAIGGGAMGNGGEVRVNGGYVKATSIYMNVPGIGKGLGGSTSNGTLYIAPKMVVKAGEISILDDEDIKTPDPETHILEIQNAWTNFLIEEGAEPVGTYHSIQYRDEFGYIIDGLSPTQYEEGVGVSLATAIPSKAGFMFAYWYEYGAEDTPVTAVSAEDTEDKVFYVKWTPIVYSITYYLKGAPVALEPSTYTATNYVTMLPEQANGYYVDWYDNDQLAGDKVWYLSHGSYGNTNFWASSMMAARCSLSLIRYSSMSSPIRLFCLEQRTRMDTGLLTGTTMSDLTATL